MASEMYVDTIAASDGTSPATLTKQSAAKGWVNFNGTGTIAARDSLNLSSLTDNGTGDYTINISSAMSNANYGAVCGASAHASAATFSCPYSGASYVSSAPTASAFRYANFAHNSAAYKDVPYTSATINGDLA